MSLLLSLVAALIGAAVFEALRVPAGALVGAMIAVAAVNLGDFAIADVPGWARFAAFATIGWLIGTGIDRASLAAIGQQAGMVLGSVAVLLAVGGVLTWLWVRSGQVDAATAFLATSPGGLSQMAALSAAVGANAALVTTLHVLRVVVVVLAAPWIVRLL